MGRGPMLTTTTGELMSTLALEEWLPAERLKGVVSSHPSSYPSGTIWPHGEWSLGWARERADGGGNDGAAWYVSDDAIAAQMTPGWAHSVPFDLSDTANSHKRPKRGLNGITGYGQQMIKAAGHLLQEKFPRHRKTLGTLTLPEMSHAARLEVVENWSELTRQLLQWVARKLRIQGLPEVVLSVCEIQPRRLAQSGEGYLHWHLLWLNVPAKSGQWTIEPNDLRAWLDGALRRLCPSYTGGFVNVDTKAVEGVVAAYLAKYMSKGKQMIEEALEDWGADVCPSTWWNMTKAARDMVKAATHRGREAGAVLDECFQHALRIGFDEVYAFLSPCFLELDNSRIIIGWRGRFQPEVFPLLLGVLESR